MKKYIEQIKTGTLIVLVLLSFGFTAFLWSNSSYSIEESENNYEAVPRFGSSANNQDKKLFQFARPPITILHQKGHHAYLESNQAEAEYQAIISSIHQVELENLLPTSLSPDQWKQLMNQTGIEFQYYQPVSVDQYDIFYNRKLENVINLDHAGTIERVWYTVNGDGVSSAYFFVLSPTKQRIIYHANTKLPNVPLHEMVAKAWPKHKYMLTLSPFDSSSTTMPDVFAYFPIQPVNNFTEEVYNVKTINIDQMKEALFQDPNIKPLSPEDKNLLFTSGTRTLLYHQESQQMEYTGRSSTTNTNNLKIGLSQEVNKVKDFVSKHGGWTGDYILDYYLPRGEQLENFFTFRLLHLGIPVYWNTDLKENTNISPSQIRLNAKSSDSYDVGNYERSMYYLGDRVSTRTASLPGKDEIIKVLEAKKIHISLVEKIQPIYLATWITPKDKGKTKQIKLTPYWNITVTNQSKKPSNYYIGEGNTWIGDEPNQY